MIILWRNERDLLGKNSKFVSYFSSILKKSKSFEKKTSIIRE